MAAFLARLCISSVVLGVTLNEAKPLADEKSHQSRHRFLQHPPTSAVAQHSVQSDVEETPESQARSRSLLASRTTATAPEHSLIANSRGFARFGRLDSNRSPVKHLKRGGNPGQHADPSAVVGGQNNYLRGPLAPAPNDQSGSDSSVLFIGPDYEYGLGSGDVLGSGESQPNAQEAPAASAPYPPTVREGSRPAPAVQAVPSGSSSLASPGRGVAFSPPGAPYPPASRVPFARTDSPDLTDSESVGTGVSYSAPFNPQVREAMAERLSPPESPDTEPSFSEHSFFLSAPPAARRRTGEVDFIQANSLGAPDRPEATRSSGLSSSATRDDSDGTRGLNDENRISGGPQDETLRSPFLANPDFFAFSSPAVDALGRLTGRPFGFGAGFNQEGSSIGDAAYIVPDDLAKDLDFELPESEPPRETFGLTVDDGQSVRNELRKETGEFIESFTSADGTSRSETGVLVPTEGGGRVLVLRGFYSYRSPEGLTVRVDYTSDQNGYRATPTITGTPKAPAS